MRRGEVAGLRWADVDLAAKLIHVRQAAIVVNYELRLTDLKTVSGRRTLDVNDDVVRLLHGWRRNQAEERLLVGARYGDHDLVFARPDGTPTLPEIISRTFDRIVARTRLPRIRFHDVRHTHASLLLEAGVPVKVVSERLGHATPSFTLDVYGWVLPGMQAEAAAFSRLMSADPVEDSQGERTRRTVRRASSSRLTYCSCHSFEPGDTPPPQPTATARLWSTSGARSAPFGQTIVPSSESTVTCAKKAGSRSGRKTGPTSPVTFSARSTSKTNPSANMSRRRYPPRGSTARIS
jgi:hypothetical protein